MIRVFQWQGNGHKRVAQACGCCAGVCCNDWGQPGSRRTRHASWVGQTSQNQPWDDREALSETAGASAAARRQLQDGQLAVCSPAACALSGSCSQAPGLLRSTGFCRLRQLQFTDINECHPSSCQRLLCLSAASAVVSNLNLPCRCHAPKLIHVMVFRCSHLRTWRPWTCTCLSSRTHGRWLTTRLPLRRCAPCV